MSDDSTSFILSDLEQEKLDNAVGEAVQSLMREKGTVTKEKQLRADIFEEAIKNQKVPIDKSRFNAIVAQRFEGKSTAIIEKHEEIEAIEEILCNRKKTSAPSEQE